MAERARVLGRTRRFERAHGLRDRRGEVLFMDARRLGPMVDRTRRELTGEDIARIADTYHAWRSEDGPQRYEDVAGFCKSADLEEVCRHGHLLTPGRYVGAESAPDDSEPFPRRWPASAPDVASSKQRPPASTPRSKRTSARSASARHLRPWIELGSTMRQSDSEE